MILHTRFGTAIVTAHPSLCILELIRHGLSLNRTIELSKLHFHVHNAAAADGTFVRGFHVLIVAPMMNGMAAAHEHNCLGGGEHILPTDGTVTVGGALDAPVRVPD